MEIFFFCGINNSLFTTPLHYFLSRFLNLLLSNSFALFGQRKQIGIVIFTNKFNILSRVFFFYMSIWFIYYLCEREYEELLIWFVEILIFKTNLLHGWWIVNVKHRLSDIGAEIWDKIDNTNVNVEYK